MAVDRRKTRRTASFPQLLRTGQASDLALGRARRRESGGVGVAAARGGGGGGEWWGGGGWLDRGGARGVVGRGAGERGGRGGARTTCERPGAPASPAAGWAGDRRSGGGLPAAV